MNGMAFVCHVYRHLTLEWNTSQFKFAAERFFVYRFEKAWTENAVHFYGCTDYLLSQVVVHGFLCVLCDLCGYLPFALNASARMADRVVRGEIASGSVLSSSSDAVPAFHARSNAGAKSAVFSTISPCRP